MTHHTISFVLNGERVSARVQPGETILDTLRDNFALYGARDSIGRPTIVAGEHDDPQALLAKRGNSVARRCAHRIGDCEQTGERPVDRDEDDARAFATVTIGRGVDRLMPAVFKTYDVWNKRIKTHKLNAWLREMETLHPPPLAKGRRIRLRFITQIKIRPPTFVMSVSQPEELGDDYLRTYALEVGADGTKFDACVKDPATEQVVEQDARVEKDRRRVVPAGLGARGAHDLGVVEQSVEEFP